VSGRVAGITGDKIAGGTRVGLLMLACLPALAQTGAWPASTYTYDGSTWTPGGSTTAWQANGGASFGSSSLTFGSGGSAMGTTTVSHQR
jgi:hypothetical protein